MSIGHGISTGSSPLDQIIQAGYAAFTSALHDALYLSAALLAGASLLRRGPQPLREHRPRYFKQLSLARTAPYVTNPALTSPTLRLRRYVNPAVQGVRGLGRVRWCLILCEWDGRADEAGRPAWCWVALLIFSIW